MHVPHVLQRYSGGAGKFAVEATTVAGALDALFALCPDLRTRVLNDKGELHPYLRLFRNDTQAELTDALAGGDQLEIVGAVEGG